MMSQLIGEVVWPWVAQISLRNAFVQCPLITDTRSLAKPFWTKGRKNYAQKTNKMMAFPKSFLKRVQSPAILCTFVVSIRVPVQVPTYIQYDYVIDFFTCCFFTTAVALILPHSCLQDNCHRCNKTTLNHYKYPFPLSF